MAMDDDYIVLPRKILDWEWYRDVNTFRLFVHMLFKANQSPGQFAGVEIKSGAFVASYAALGSESGLTVKEVRTAVRHLIDSGELTVKRYPKFTVFEMTNYSLYQSEKCDSQSMGRVSGMNTTSSTSAIS